MKLYRLPPLFLQSLFWAPTRIILKIFTDFEVRGISNVQNLPRGVIFVSNHQSELDPILITASLPFLSHHFPMFYTSREKSFYIKSGWRQIFYGGLFFKMWGAYPVRVGLRDYGDSLVCHAEIIKDGGSVCIFPEGKRTVDNKIGPVKGGAAYLSYVTKAPIVPVKIEGVWRTSPKDFFWRKRKCRITIGQPIFPDEIFFGKSMLFLGVPDDDCVLATRRVMDEVISL